MKRRTLIIPKVEQQEALNYNIKFDVVHINTLGVIFVPTNKNYTDINNNNMADDSVQIYD